MRKLKVLNEIRRHAKRGLCTGKTSLYGIILNAQLFYKTLDSISNNWVI